MSTCSECGQLLPPEAKRCPACGHDLHARPSAESSRFDRDEEQDNDELLSAVVAEGTERKPPPWVPSLEERMRPKPNADGGPENADLFPAPVPVKKGRWRRLFG